MRNFLTGCKLETFLLCLCLLEISCSHEKKELIVSSTLIRTTDSTYVQIGSPTYKTYVFDLNLTNKTDSEVSFWIMKCAKWKSWILDQDSLAVVPWPCDGNYPVIEKLASGNSMFLKVSVANYAKGRSSSIDSLKFGFLYFDKSIYTQDDFLRNIDSRSVPTLIWEK